MKSPFNTESQAINTGRNIDKINSDEIMAERYVKKITDKIHKKYDDKINEHMSKINRRFNIIVYTFLILFFSCAIFFTIKQTIKDNKERAEQRYILHEVNKTIIKENKNSKIKFDTLKYIR